MLSLHQIWNDMKERKEETNNPQKFEEKLRSLFDSVPVALMIASEEELLYVNPAFESIFGLTTKEVRAMRLMDLVHPDMQGLVKEQAIAHQRGGTETKRHEFKAITKDRQTKWIDLSTASINYCRQKVTLAAAYDITEIKQTQSSLQVMERELKDKTNELEEMNSALKIIFEKREDVKIEIEEKIQFNVKQLIEPYLYDLKKTPLSLRQAFLVDTIKTNLDEIISPFACSFASAKYKLTPQEIKVAVLIRQGKKTKNIADLMSLSPRTIEFHRTKIRHKMGLKNKTDSLQSFLLSLN